MSKKYYGDLSATLSLFSLVLSMVVFTMIYFKVNLIVIGFVYILTLLVVVVSFVAMYKEVKSK